MLSKCISYGLTIYRILSKNSSPLVQRKFRLLRQLEKTVEGDEYLEFSDESLERRRNIRELFRMGISC